MRIAFFTHSLVSCWNHGNAHFLRGVMRALSAEGHQVRALEPESGWSRRNLLADHGVAALDGFAQAFPDLLVQTYRDDADPAALVDDADVVVVHEWSDPALIAAIGRLRARGGRFTLLFHDTHHRAVSDPDAMRALDLSGFDGVLAFGAALADVYRRWGWGNRVFVWHEAADTTLFHPPTLPTRRHGVVWIGNWGDGERSAELRDFLIGPLARIGIGGDVHGVRYPPDVVALLREVGVSYHGWLPNAHVPQVFAQHRVTLHVPRRFYATSLPGIPTIRVFEALACGIPLVCTPWEDSESLFRPGQDYLVARNGAEMERHLRALLHDAALCASLAANGLDRIRTHHSCDHRAGALLGIASRLRSEVAA